MRLLVGLILFFKIVACTPISRHQGGDILIIGDSVMAWNRSSGGDIGSVIGSELNRDVVNRSVPGAQVRIGGLASFIGLSIPAQLPPGRWNWVVMNGGANDLGFSCGCTRCDAEIDALISEDGTTGDIPDLASKAQTRGARVLWMGYYKSPESTSFKGCRPSLVELEKRIAEFAGTQEAVFFLDAEDVFRPPAPKLFASDKTHPSIKGSAEIGKALARLIAGNLPS